MYSLFINKSYFLVNKLKSHWQLIITMVNHSTGHACHRARKPKENVRGARFLLCYFMKIKIFLFLDNLVVLCYLWSMVKPERLPYM